MQKLTYSLVAIVLLAIIGAGWGIDQFFENYEQSESPSSDIVSHYSQLGEQLASSIDSISKPHEFIAQWNQQNKNRISLVNKTEFPLPLPLENDFLENRKLVLESDNKLSLHFYLPKRNQVFSFIPEELIHVRSNSSVNLFLTGLFYTIIFVLVLLWSYPLIKRLNLLRDKAVKFGSGDLTQRLELSKTSYISEIETEFNRMAQRVESLVNDNKLISSAVSHDLRTPLARLRLGIDVLSESNNQANRDKYQKRLSRDIDEMQSLVEVLLDYAKLEQSLIKQDVKPTDLNKLVKQCADYSNNQDVSTKVVIELLEGNRSMEVAGDEKYLGLLFNNLLGNAVKYCNHKVIVELALEKNHCIINIHDDGKGINHDNQSDIFKPFIKYNSDSYGMGLAIAERITHWHKGNISVTRSQLIGGALFKVSFPRILS